MDSSSLVRASSAALGSHNAANSDGCGSPDELGRTHPRVRRQARCRGQEQEGDPAVPKAARGP